jgi:hypothetical protein
MEANSLTSFRDSSLSQNLMELSIIQTIHQQLQSKEDEDTGKHQSHLRMRIGMCLLNFFKLECDLISRNEKLVQIPTNHFP